MNRKFKLETFDLERAKAGNPVCTRTLNKVNIITFDRDNSDHPITALINVNDDDYLLVHATNEGKFNDNDSFFMLKKVCEGWINVYKEGYTDELIYGSEWAAYMHKKDNEGYITSVKVEWEE